MDDICKLVGIRYYILALSILGLTYIMCMSAKSINSSSLHNTLNYYATNMWCTIQTIKIPVCRRDIMIEYTSGAVVFLSKRVKPLKKDAPPFLTSFCKKNAQQHSHYLCTSSRTWMNAFKNMSFAIAWPTILITIGKMRKKKSKKLTACPIVEQ